MKRRPGAQASLSSAVILCCAAFAVFAKRHGFSDFAVALGTTVLGAVVLGCLWRILPQDPDD